MRRGGRQNRRFRTWAGRTGWQLWLLLGRVGGGPGRPPWEDAGRSATAAEIREWGAEAGRRRVADGQVFPVEHPGVPPVWYPPYHTIDKRLRAERGGGTRHLRRWRRPRLATWPAVGAAARASRSRGWRTAKHEYRLHLYMWSCWVKHKFSVKLIGIFINCTERLVFRFLSLFLTRV